MVAHCSFFRSSTAFPTVRTPYCLAVGSALLIPPLVNGISDGSRALLLSGWQRIAHSFSRQRLFRQFARCIAPRMAAHCSFFRSSTAFPTVRTPYCSAVGSTLLIPPLVNGISDGSRAVLLSGWQRIAHYFSRQRLFRRFARRIARQMAADCSYFRSSTAFTMDARRIAPRMAGGLLIPPLVNCFHDGSRAVLLSGWQRIAHTSARQRLPRRFARCIAQRMAAPCLFLHSLTAFPTVRAPYCSADGSGLLTLTLVNGFHDGLRAVLFPGWQRIAHTSARQWLSRRFAHRMAQRMAAHCSFFRSSTAFATVRAPYYTADGSGLLIPELVNGFPVGLRAVLLGGWQRIAHSSAR